MKAMARGSLVVVGLLACSVLRASDLKANTVSAQAWQSFWESVNVTPPPPRGFLDAHVTGRIENLTQGKLSNDTVRRWVLADLRRGKGDAWAGYNLRDDVVDAGIFGPPGLNGTDAAIRSMRERGVVRIEGPTTPNIIAAAVIAVSPQARAEGASAGLTEFVIVLLYRPGRGRTAMIHRDGRREVSEGPATSELHWQLDTGHFFEHPVLGPLWYQQNGWSCAPEDSPVGKLCALVKP